MPIYQHETIEVVPGKMKDYLNGIIQICVPEVCEPRKMRLTGFFQTDGTTGRWPEATAIWELADWATYAWKQRGGAGHQGLNRWQSEAIKWRTAGFDRMLVPLPFSPRPPVFPDIKARGAIVVQEVVTVWPGKMEEYLSAVQQVVIPGAERQGLALEAFWRSAFRPLELLALWSVKSWDAYAAQQERAFGDAAKGAGPTWPREIWSYLSHLEQKILVPAPFSPLGGGGEDYNIVR